jgi:hypothetical protein
MSPTNKRWYRSPRTAVLGGLAALIVAAAPVSAIAASQDTLTPGDHVDTTRVDKPTAGDTADVPRDVPTAGDTADAPSDVPTAGDTRDPDVLTAGDHADTSSPDVLTAGDHVDAR